MVIQCPACQTRFRLADDKVKGDGIKVRCSKCKHIFAVPPSEPSETLSQPSIPTPAAQPTSIAFPSEPAGGAPRAQEDSPPTIPQQEEGPAEPFATAAVPPDAAEKDEDEIDFGGHNMEFVDDEAEDGTLKYGYDRDTEQEDEPPVEASETDHTGGGQEFDFSDETTGGPTEFDFDDEPAPAASTADEFSFEDEQPPALNEFSFDDAASEKATGEEFSFGEETTENDAFSFDDSTEKPAEAADEYAAENDEFSFGDEGNDGADGFSFDDDEEEDDSFDFGDEDKKEDAFSFDDESPAVDAAPAIAEPKPDFGLKDELEFGTTGPTTTESSDDSITRDIAQPVEPSPAPRPAPRLPAKKKKSPYRGVLLFMLVLLLGLGGAAGYLYYKGDSLNWRSLVDRITGQAPLAPAKGQIQLSGLTSYFVKNRESGQLFIIEGQVINQYPEARSAIAVKGILFNEKGKQVLQQTVFAGNPMDERALRTLPYSKIQENMNNQFGDSLSNLNVEPNKSIPFTIVFRNLPSDLAEFTVEVTDSKPGGQQ